MPGKTIKIRSTDGGEFDCYLAHACGRRQGAGGGAGLRRARRRRGHPRPRRRVRRARLHRRGARPVLALGAGAARPRRQAHARSARSRGWRRSRPASATWSTRSRICARCRSSTAAPRPWASATAAPTRSSGRSGSATTPASPATARRCCDFIDELDGVTAAGLHHLGRPGSPRAAGGARRLSPGAGAHAERRGAHLPGHPARLHDAGQHQGATTRRRATSR